MTSFEGFPEELLDFYEGLIADNTKAYWTDNKRAYDEAVRAPLDALVRELEPLCGAGKIFRPYRDVRFSKDKTPYKTHAGVVLAAPSLYLQVGADGLALAGGYWQAQSDQVTRLREAVADDRTGTALVGLLDRLRSAGWDIGGRALVRVPKPYEADHPRADLLRHKGLTAWHAYEPAEWLHEPVALDRIRAGFAELTPLTAWLATHVGPSRLDNARRR